jgi:putative PIN family toxin of toxin-antitoxin system
LENLKVLLRATVDTNLFVSGVIHAHGTPGALLDAVVQQKFILVTSLEQRAELEGVLQRPKFTERYGVSDAQRQAILRTLDRVGVFVSPALIPADIVRDKKDHHIVGTAIAGNADCLVSGDKDLLAIHGHVVLGAIKIVTCPDFLSVL